MPRKNAAAATDFFVACAQLAESATLGGAILTALHGQRRALEGVAQRQADVADELHESSNVMQRLTRRVFVRRATYIGVACLLVAAIVVAWWLKAKLGARHEPGGGGYA